MSNKFMSQPQSAQINLSSIKTDLSIVIVSYKRLDCLRKCIRSIIDTIKKIQYEIIIVDNQSADGTPEIICEEFPSLRMIENSENLGFAKGNNRGMLASKGKFILLLNNDTEALPESIETLFEIISHSPEVGLLGCQLIHQDLNIQQSFGRMLNPMTQLVQNYLLIDL
jgi:Predicted glycosyltransferases